MPSGSAYQRSALSRPKSRHRHPSRTKRPSGDEAKTSGVWTSKVKDVPPRDRSKHGAVSSEPRRVESRLSLRGGGRDGPAADRAPRAAGSGHPRRRRLARRPAPGPRRRRTAPNRSASRGRATPRPRPLGSGARPAPRRGRRTAQGRGCPPPRPGDPAKYGPRRRRSRPRVRRCPRPTCFGTPDPSLDRCPGCH